MITIFYERLKRYSLWSSQEIKWFPCKFACNLNLFVIFTFIFIEIRFEKDLAEDNAIPKKKKEKWNQKEK